MKNRKGTIFITKGVLEFEHDRLLLVFSKFIPLFIQEDFEGKKYYGISPLFDEVEEGHVIPEYEAVITEVSKSEHKVEFKRLA